MTDDRNEDGGLEFPQPMPGEETDDYVKRLALYAFRYGCRRGFNMAMDVMNHNFDGLTSENPKLAEALKTLAFRVREGENEIFDSQTEEDFETKFNSNMMH